MMPRFWSRYRRLLAVAIVAVLVVMGSTTALAMTAQAAADQQAKAEADAAQALEQKLTDYYLGALERLQPVGTQLVDDATAWATSESPLLTAIDVSSLQSTADAVGGGLARTPPSGATSAELEELFDSQWALIGGARQRLAGFVATAAAAAKAHVDAAPIADSASRQAVADATAALQSVLSSHTSIVAPFTALTESVAAVDASQAAAAAAQARQRTPSTL